MFSEMGIMKNIKAVYTIARPTGLENKDKNEKEEKKEKENEEEKIDKSSYEKTLVDNDSVITFDNNKKDATKKITLDDMGNNLKIINEIQTNSSRNQLMEKNKDVVLEVKNYK